MPTYRKEGVYEGMSGKGVTRIDTVLTNEAGKNLVKGVDYKYTRAALYDHVALEVTLDAEAAQQKARKAKSTRPLS